MDGQAPAAPLVQGTDGNFYGTTDNGGTSPNCQSGCGTVFQLTPDGVLTTLHSFDGSDGQEPSGLVQATDGPFYGTTFVGGRYFFGTVFRLGVVRTCATCRP